MRRVVGKDRDRLPRPPLSKSVRDRGRKCGIVFGPIRLSDTLSFVGYSLRARRSYRVGLLAVRVLRASRFLCRDDDDRSGPGGGGLRVTSGPSSPDVPSKIARPVPRKAIGRHILFPSDPFFRSSLLSSAEPPRKYCEEALTRRFARGDVSGPTESRRAVMVVPALLCN